MPVGRLIGSEVASVEARAKHLLLRTSGGDTVHTHLGMTGSWHVYPAGEPWQRPERQARLVVEAGDRLAVVFNCPTVEMLRTRDEARHPVLARLGPDVLAEPLDLDGIRRRAATVPATTQIGDVLLDQTVVSGIGNIWRCEALHACRIHPRTPWGDVGPDVLDALVVAAAGPMAASVEGRRPAPKVYGRAGRPCGTCGEVVAAARTGRHARTAYWCPRCQNRP